MSVFGQYAHYYDLLYHDKDYEDEVRYVECLFAKYKPKLESLLDLGCGTGRHASLLASNGYFVHGVDSSKDMIEEANRRLRNLPSDTKAKLTFEHADICCYRSQRKFDAVAALFHVISYQTTNEDLTSALSTARNHLEPGGLFIFDCWYGPAVLSQGPTVRVKRIQNETTAVTRISEPTMRSNDNIVDVNYQLFVKDKSSGSTVELQETHTIRFLFKPEVDSLLSQTGFELLHFAEWMTDKRADLDTWNVYFVARA